MMEVVRLTKPRIEPACLDRSPPDRLERFWLYGKAGIGLKRLEAQKSRGRWYLIRGDYFHAFAGDFLDVIGNRRLQVTSPPSPTTLLSLLTTFPILFSKRDVTFFLCFPLCSWSACLFAQKHPVSEISDLRHWTFESTSNLVGCGACYSHHQFEQIDISKNNEGGFVIIAQLEHRMSPWGLVVAGALQEEEGPFVSETKAERLEIA